MNKMEYKPHGIMHNDANMEGNVTLARGSRSTE